MTYSSARSERPAVVTVAVALWWISSAASLVTGLVYIASRFSTGGGAVGAVLGTVFALAWTAWISWGALRLGRGSARARFWLAVLAAVDVLGVVLALVGLVRGAAPGTVVSTDLGSLAVGVAAVLSYLPSARAFFPRPGPRAERVPEPAIVGWDPNTGEPIRASE